MTDVEFLVSELKKACNTNLVYVIKNPITGGYIAIIDGERYTCRQTGLAELLFTRGNDAIRIQGRDDIDFF